jgi:hypothetical protein
MAKRRYNTKRGINRQIKSITQKPRKRHKARRHTTAAERLEAKKYRIRKKKRLTSKDIKLDKLRSRFLKDRRDKKAGKSKKRHALRGAVLGTAISALGAYKGGRFLEKRKQEKQEHENALKAAASRAKNRAKKKAAGSSNTQHALSLTKKLAGTGAVLGTTYLVGRKHGHDDNLRKMG